MPRDSLPCHWRFKQTPLGIQHLCSRDQAADFETEVKQAERPVLVDFFSQTCFSYRHMFPLISELEEELNGEVKVVKFDAGTEAGSKLASQFSVRAVPNFVLFLAGLPISQRVGSCSKNELRKWIEESLL